MKKLILLIALISFGLIANSQTVLPRYGTTPNRNNTGSMFTYGYVSITGTLMTINGANFNYNGVTVYVSSAANATILGSRLTTGLIGDNIKIVFATASGQNIYTFQNTPLTATGWSFNMAGPLTVAGTKNANIEFINTGSNRYVEMNRFVEP